MKARQLATRLLVYFADALTPKDGSMGDFEYGIRMARRASSNPPQCVCVPCVLGRGTCTYEKHEIGFALPEEGPPEVMFDLHDDVQPVETGKIP